ncbi:hypothetical protein [Pontibacter chitinilyticus]|uniref:hypothetical protein n=1 Tax=Pontibacter chitinilyticus TaxID=2674989 RepID=UPI0032198854
MEQLLIDRLSKIPSHSCVVKDSIPVICFGNLNTARVATLGLNPSKNEFLNKGQLINGNNKRFENLKTLDGADLSHLNKDQIQKALSSCINYFHNNPYNRWFNHIENYILNKLNVSYYNGTCCHLDLVQWATDPVWGKLNKETKSQLMTDDFPFLKEQLLRSNINTLLINGSGATRYFCSQLQAKASEEDVLQVGNMKCRVAALEINLGDKEMMVYTWSQNLQSSPGMTNFMKDAIGNWVKANIQ